MQLLHSSQSLAQLFSCMPGAGRAEPDRAAANRLAWQAVSREPSMSFRRRTVAAHHHVVLSSGFGDLSIHSYNPSPSLQHLRNPRLFVRRVLELNGGNRRRELTLEDTTLAGLGIMAIIESTRAFHGLEATITNPFETAVEQLGNLVVLLAASVDPTLRNFTSESMLKEFFSWAIGFLRAVAHPTSALQTILSILVGLERKVIENPGYFGGQKWNTLGISVE
ncbi:hypothetical protein VTG60DRAFT_6070 [Thermothelomyces hinnuleus]